MTRNVELLQQTMQHILDHPEQHDQSIWKSDCGTTGCFAGWAVTLSGIDMVSDWRDAGATVLGLTWLEQYRLFHANNSLPALELMVKDLVNGSELRDVYEYWDEAES